AESRAVSEQLAGRFQALVIHFGSWFPDVSPSVVVIDPAALAPARARDRTALITDLQTRTRSGGVQIVLHSPPPPAAHVIPLAPGALQTLYRGWEITHRRRTKTDAGFTAKKTESQPDHDLHQSDTKHPR